MSTSDERNAEPDLTHEERIARTRAEIAAAQSEIAEITTADAVSKEIVALGPSAVPAEVAKAQMAQARGRALKKANEMKALATRLSKELEAQAAAEKAAMDLMMAPLLAQMKQMEEGLWTVNLYLGRDEEIVPLLDGEPAPADTPFTLRQQVLTMDEEVAASAESGGIDARDIGVFDEWIKKPANLAQVFPEAKGVVALVPRQKGRDYQDPWVNERLNKENRWTYFLIRNGERLFRMRTDFIVGRNLMPRIDEFTGLFVGTRTNPKTRERETYELVPGTPEWESAEKRQDARQRHYMRMALILQGLIDRTTVYHPLPDGGLSLLADRTYADGQAALIRDGEMTLTDGREDFYAWLARLTHDLRPGMRIIGSFDGDAFTQAGGERHGSSENDYRYTPNNRISPRARSSYRASRPETGALYRLEGRKTVDGVQGFAFKFDRRGSSTRGTCTILPGDQFVIPFDLVTVEEMEYRLGARSQRSAYEHMFPLLKAAIAAKKAEAAEEAPFRDLLAAELVKTDDDLDTIEEGHSALAPLVDWWKYKNKHHRALVGEPDHERRAIKDIVAEHLARKTSANDQAPDAEEERKVVERLLAEDPTIMVIGRTRTGGYLAFAPQPRTYPAGKVGYPATNVEQPPGPTEAEKAANQALHPVHRVDEKALANKNMIPAAVTDNVWAVEYATGKTGRKITKREWVQPGIRLDATRILHVTETWENFDLYAAPTEHPTDAQIDAAIAEIIPEIDAYATAGWPSRFRINGTPDEPFTPLILGVTMSMTPGMYEDHPSLRVHLIKDTDPEGLDQEPSGALRNHVKPEYGSVRIPFTGVTKRDGIKLMRNSEGPSWNIDWKDEGRATTSTADRPWNYFWSGSAQGQIALVEFPENGAISLDRHERIEAHNKVIDDRYEETYAPLWIVKHAADKALEAAAYARFIEDYADPDLWEGHRKTLPDGSLETDMHPMGRGVPDYLRIALLRFIDEGRTFEGYTVRTLLEETTPGLSEKKLAEIEQYLDAPLWKEPEALTEADEDLDDDDDDLGDDLEVDEPDEEEDPRGFDEHGLRTDEDGVVILEGSDVIVGVVVEPEDAQDDSNLPALPDEQDDDRG